MKPARSEITARTRAPIIGLVLLAALAVLIPSRAWTTLLIALAVLVGLSYLWVWLLVDGLSAERSLTRRWVAVGDRLEEWFTLKNNSPVPAIWLELSDQSNMPGYRAAAVRSLSPYGNTKWRERAICEQRGRYTIGPWAIRTGDPFGLFEAVVFLDQTDEIIIHPPIHSDLPVPLPSGFGEGQSRVQRRTWQAAVNVGGLRDYHPGDPLHHIHWRKSASSGDLMVRQFDRDTAGDIWILLDLDESIQLGKGLDGTEEHGILLAASLSAQSLASDRAIGIAAYGAEPLIVPPARGEGQQWRILQALALISAESQTPIEQAIGDLSRVVQNESAVLIITANLDPAWIPTLLAFQQRGVAVTVALFDRTTFGDKISPGSIEGELSRLTIQSYRLRRGDIGQAPSIEELGETIVTPFGRTIVREPV